MSAPVSSMRLDRLLANLGYGSRKQIQLMVRERIIVVDGAPVRRADEKFSLTPDLPTRLRIDGEPLDPLPGVALLLHKPLGATCSHKEPGQLVYDLLPERWRHRSPAISTIGRLDKETSGLLLLTDDGDLLHRVISPRSDIAKRYHVTLDRPLTGTEADMIASGTMLLEGEDKPLLPALLDVLSPNTAHLTIREGRYHQVRRMFAALGNHVDALHRDRIGGLDLPRDLPAGAFRVLDDANLSVLFSGAVESPAAQR